MLIREKHTVLRKKLPTLPYGKEGSLVSRLIVGEITFNTREFFLGAFCMEKPYLISENYN